MGVLKFRRNGSWMEMPVVRGPKGDVGPAADIIVGNVETLGPAGQAYASFERVDPSDPRTIRMNLGIPRGHDASVPFYVRSTVNGYQQSGTGRPLGPVSVYTKGLDVYKDPVIVSVAGTVSWTRRPDTGAFLSATIDISDASGLSSASPHSTDGDEQWEGTFSLHPDSGFSVRTGPVHGISYDSSVYVDCVAICPTETSVGGRTWEAGTILFGYAEPASGRLVHVFASASPDYPTYSVPVDSPVEMEVDQSPTAGHNTSLVTSAGVANAVALAKSETDGMITEYISAVASEKLDASSVPELSASVDRILAMQAYINPPVAYTQSTWTRDALSSGCGLSRLLVQSSPESAIDIVLPMTASQDGSLVDLIVCVVSGANATFNILPPNLPETIHEVSYADSSTGTISSEPLADEGKTLDMVGPASFRLMQLSVGSYMLERWS